MTELDNGNEERRVDEQERGAGANSAADVAPKNRPRTVPTATASATAAGLVGNALEWYDFAVYGALSDVLSEVFFPQQAGDAALLETWAVFAGAFLMRPVGGAVLVRVRARESALLARKLPAAHLLAPVPCLAILLLSLLPQGYIGDRYSRKRALVLSMALMAIPTFVVGILPSYNVAGLWATSLLVIARTPFITMTKQQ